MKDKILIALCAFYLLLTSANLTLLPIFNDESIYLDWGIRSTTKPGMLYYSVNDGKPPLMIWFFGIFVHFINDPLFAGRFVSILFGVITLVGIFFLSRFLFGKRTAYVTSLLYIVTPLIFFYNRQSLMESGVAASGVWSTYLP
jgi:4-amino-4-deoxy-L-arabinose transferase-like glycosyltransferase